MNGTRKPATMIDSKYKVEDGFQTRYFHAKAKATIAAREMSSWHTAILCTRKAAGEGWEMIARYRFGRAA